MTSNQHRNSHIHIHIHRKLPHTLPTHVSSPHQNTVFYILDLKMLIWASETFHSSLNKYVQVWWEKSYSGQPRNNFSYDSDEAYPIHTSHGWYTSLGWGLRKMCSVSGVLCDDQILYCNLTIFDCSNICEGWLGLRIQGKYSSYSQHCCLTIVCG